MIVYADDWVLISETVEEHAELLERVLQRCREAKFVLHPGKSDFFVNGVTFLGFHVKDGQVQPEDKAEAFKTWPTPKRARDVRAFLGAANYLAHMIPRFREIVAPLDELTGRVAVGKNQKRKDVPFVWGARQQQAFDTICERLASAPVLALPDLGNRNFVVRTDASIYGLGGVCLQKQKDNEEQPVGYYSRKTTPAEKVIDIRTLELLAVVCTLRKFERWLAGATIDVYVDHQSLVYLATTCPVKDRLCRCLDTLQQHRLVWHYVPGEQNVLPDALSRRADYMEDEKSLKTEVFRRYMRAAVSQASGGKVAPEMLQGDGGSHAEPERPQAAARRNTRSRCWPA
jgi:hypothetical protein